MILQYNLTTSVLNPPMGLLKPLPPLTWSPGFTKKNQTNKKLSKLNVVHSTGLLWGGAAWINEGLICFWIFQSIQEFLKPTWLVTNKPYNMGNINGKVVHVHRQHFFQSSREIQCDKLAHWQGKFLF